MREGDKRLQEFLNEQALNPILILSDGLPGDLLPAPVYLPLAVKCDDPLKAKKLKKVCWLLPDAFDSFRKGNADINIGNAINAYKPFTTLHSSPNRFSGATGGEGSLFEIEEFSLDTKAVRADYIAVYLKIRDGYEDKVVALFNDLSLSGYGKKKSVGKGSFTVAGALEPFDGFDDFTGSNGYVSLSHFVPDNNDPVCGYYKTKVKYGRLGGSYTFCGNPFKKPLLIMTPGSAFKLSGPAKPYYGRMIEHISHAKAEVMHYGYAFSVPARIDV